MMARIVEAVDGWFADCRRRGIDVQKAGRLLGIPYQTVQRRQRDPGSYKMTEVLAISKATKIPVEELVVSRREKR